MLAATVIMFVLALTLIIVGYTRGDNLHMAGLQNALSMITQILPLLIAAFIVAGMVQVLLPQELMAKWVGAESGWKGIFIGTVAGGLSPGGPYVSLPIAAGLLNSGAGVGTMVAYLTGWSLWAVGRLPMDVGILGWRLTMIRIVSTFFLPFIAGWIANFFFASAKL